VREHKRLQWIGVVCATILFVACQSSAPVSKSSPPALHATTTTTCELPPSTVLIESSEDDEAQRAWCEYLDALHRRAMSPSAPMPSFQKCLHARTYAAAKMLRQTAQCSRHALDQFEGDPFTREYAAAVARCGSDALDACEAERMELEPFFSIICAGMTRCSETSADECRFMLDHAMRPHLSRAVGALNDRGRAAFQACLKNMTCSEIGPQIVECLDPIMAGLLWLPE